MQIFQEIHMLEAKHPLKWRFVLIERLVGNLVFLNLTKTWLREVSEGKLFLISSYGLLANYCNFCRTHFRNTNWTFLTIYGAFWWFSCQLSSRPKFISAFRCDSPVLTEQSHLELIRSVYLDSPYFLPLSMSRLHTFPAWCPYLGQLRLRASATNTCIPSWGD